MTEWPDTIGPKIIKSIDSGVLDVIESVSYAMPNNGQFNTSDFVAYGYNVPGDLISQHAVITLAYVIVVTTVGYFFFKSREIAA